MRKLRPASALQEILSRGYKIQDFRSDVLAGLVVGLVSLPLAMALAIASGVPPQHGLYTAIIGGFVIALLGGSATQVSGPTAAFVVILAPIVHHYGLGGLLIAGLMAGIILIFMGVLRLGKLIQFIPFPVTTGFTTGIAIVIASIQIKDFFGLEFAHSPESFGGRILEISQSLMHFSPIETAIGFSTLALLLLWPLITNKIPAPLAVLSLVSFGLYLLSHFFPELQYASIGSRFSYQSGDQILAGIPQLPPSFSWPWSWGGSSDNPLELNYSLIRSLLPSAFAIAMLGAIESLLTAVVADGMAKTRHDPDAELLALGTGNLICPFFGGIAATGAIARTATNIRYGAKSPIAAMTHALFVLLCVLLFAPLVSYLPMASLAALLLVVAYNMAELKHFTHIIRVAPKSDVWVLLTCFGLTVIFDMVIGVGVGVVLAAFLFMRQMSELVGGGLLDLESTPDTNRKVPPGVFIYEISGPLFFGAASAAMNALTHIQDQTKVIIFDMRNVPHMDATGLVAFEESLLELHRRKIKVILSQIQHQPLELLKQSLIGKKDFQLNFSDNLNESLSTAHALLP